MQFKYVEIPIRKVLLGDFTGILYIFFEVNKIILKRIPIFNTI